MQNLKINLPFFPKKMYITSMKKLPLALAVLALVAVFAIGFSLGKTKEKNDVIKQQEMELSKVQEKKKIATQKADSIMATLPEEQRNNKETRNQVLSGIYIADSIAAVIPPCKGDCSGGVSELLGNLMSVKK
jgi:uncharacterized membrane protein YraQ (UPF0718 family)